MIDIQATRAAIVEPVFVQTADDTEYQLIRTAQEAANSGNWIVGECACRWLHTYAKGRTDEAFGELIGLTRTQVQQRRQVWERFGKTHSKYANLTWSHFREALQWDEADEMLEWAEECGATVREMAAYRSVTHGDFGQAGGADKCDARDNQAQNAGETSDSGQKPEGRTIFTSLPATPRTPAAPQSTTTHHKSPAQAAGRADSAPEQSPAAANPEPQRTAGETETVAMVLRKIEHMISFVVERGSESEREELLEQLKPVVALLEPDPELALSAGPAGKNVPAPIQATLAVANAVVNEWNMIDGVKMCRHVTAARRQAIAARMKDPFWRANWREAIERLRNLSGPRGDNDRNWQANLDWFLRPNTVVGLLEGKYDEWNQTKEFASTSHRNEAANASSFDRIRREAAAAKRSDGG